MTDREQFEQYARTWIWSLPGCNFDRLGWRYVHEPVQFGWQMWQGARRDSFGSSGYVDIDLS
jgi:hypothetical protein